MITITCRCPFCEQTLRAGLVADRPLACPYCEKHLSRRVPDLTRKPLTQCLACPSTELFLRKDFPQRLGVSIVAIGLIASSFAWYHHWIIVTFGILFGTALIDFVLYIVMGDLLECYRCHAQYRGLPDASTHGGFDLEVHERYRQEAARLKQTGESGPST